MNLYINRKIINGPWGGGNNFVRSLHENLQSKGVRILQNPFVEDLDVIFLQSPFPEEQGGFSINEAIQIKKINPKIQIVLRVNDCDARKNTNNVDNIWIETSKFIDKTIFVSEWIKDYFLSKGWFCSKNFVLYNGVDKNIFRKNKKIDNGKTNIVTHHWSDNKMKGLETYEFLDRFVSENSDFTFSYIGRVNKSLPNTNIISPLFGKSLGDELSKYDVYISGTKFDPGPNHILESLSCEIPTYVFKEGGGSVEFVGIDNTYENFEHLKSILESKTFKYNKNIDLINWNDCAVKTLEIINENNFSSR